MAYEYDFTMHGRLDRFGLFLLRYRMQLHLQAQVFLVKARELMLTSFRKLLPLLGA